jgi:hypothetical protein
MGAVADIILHKLQHAFSPTRLELVDDSDRHHGHAGHTGAGESHFNLKIEAEAFAGKARVPSTPCRSSLPRPARAETGGAWAVFFLALGRCG